MTDKTTFRPLLEAHTPVGVFWGTTSVGSAPVEKTMTREQAQSVADQVNQALAQGHASFLLVQQLDSRNRLVGTSFVLNRELLKSTVIKWSLVEEKAE